MIVHNNKARTVGRVVGFNTPVNIYTTRVMKKIKQCIPDLRITYVAHCPIYKGRPIYTGYMQNPTDEQFNCFHMLMDHYMGDVPDKEFKM